MSRPDISGSCQNRIARTCDIGPMGNVCIGQLSRRRAAPPEVPEAVFPPHQHRGHVAIRRLACTGWEIADRETNSAICGSVRKGRVENPTMVDGHLARRQRCIGCRAFINLDGDLLAPRQQIVVDERVSMIYLPCL